MGFVLASPNAFFNLGYGFCEQINDQVAGFRKIGFFDGTVICLVRQNTDQLE